MSSLSDLRTVGAGAVAVATVAVLALQPGPTLASAADKPVSELLRDLRVLYTKTESASRAYDVTAGKLTRQRRRTQDADEALASVRSALGAARREAGELARQQYRRDDVGLPSAMQLLLLRDPQSALEGIHLIKRAAGRQAVTVHRLTDGERRQRQLTDRARSALADQQRLTVRQEKQRDTVRSRLHRVEGMLASLSGAQLTRLQSMETVREDRGQRTLMSARALSSRKALRAPSPQGEEALSYALHQIGKPYRYGAAGPNAYDCSGLTSRAWRRAGLSIPRTSQGQWRQLPHVPVNKLRPGDLVVYYRSASHVALYAGDGKVVHAPRPGSAVRLSPVGEEPLRGAVRPDAGAPALQDYRPPPKLAG